MLHEPLTEQERQELFPPPKPRRRPSIRRSLNVVLRELRYRRDLLVGPYLATLGVEWLTDEQLDTQSAYIQLAAMIDGLCAEFGDPEGLWTRPNGFSHPS